jgi:hypothetical protein
MFRDVLLVLKGLFNRFWIIAVSLLIGYYIAKNLGHQSIFSGVLPVVGLGIACYVLVMFYYPKTIYISALLVGHLIAHIGRIAPGIPFGLSIDFLLAIGFGILLFGRRKMPFQHLNKPEFIAIFVWIGYTILEIANPISPGPIAWFYAMRPMSLYFILTPIVVCGFFNSPRDIKNLIYLFAPTAFILAIIAIRQDAFGMNSYEMDWLNSGPIRTHLLRGKMREFSLLADASTFGAYSAYMCLFFGVLAALPSKLPGRGFYIFLSLLSFYGLMLSGSRGPLAIVGIGGMIYLIMSKRAGIASAGAFVGGGFYVFLRYTTILQGNYNVARLRTAFDPNDASMLVRKAKEAVLSVYMADKPIGGGIGSAGLWGERFAPGSFLANTPTDGLYSRIWMETGIIGLYLYLGVIIVLVMMMGYRLWRLPEGTVKQVLLAMYSGFVGVAVASYVNEILGQLPLSIICYSTPALILLVEHWYKQGVNIEDPPSEASPPLD